MANRLLAYRVAIELEGRRRRGWRRPSLRLADVAERLLRCAVQAHLADAGAMRNWSDYELAARSGVSLRQTAELYEEIGLGALVREVLDRLEERGMIQIARKAASGPYRGFAATAEGVAEVDVRPWHQRLLSLFDPPPGERSNSA